MLKYLVPLLFLSSAAFASQEIASKKSIICNTDVKETIDLLHEQGFQGFVKSTDINDPNQMHELAFNNKTNQVLSLSITYDKATKPLKICFDYVGNGPDGNGPVFKQFILHQNIDEFNKEMDDYIEKDKERLKKDHVPFQGDPSKVTFHN